MGYYISLVKNWDQNYHLFVIFLEGGQIFTSLGELSLLHTFTNIPVNESAFGVHEIKFVIQTSPGLGNSGSIGQHANSTRNLGQITTRNDSWGLVIDTDLKENYVKITEMFIGIYRC
jgi:hypothetical protein